MASSQRIHDRSSVPGSKRRKTQKSIGEAAQQSISENGEDEVPACTSCRRRKTKCSRQQPCLQCQRLQLDCVYDHTRERTGVKTGVIESLNQRLSMLEHMFLGQGILFKPLLEQLARGRPNGDIVTIPSDSQEQGSGLDGQPDDALGGQPVHESPAASLQSRSKALRDLCHAVAISSSREGRPSTDAINVHETLASEHIVHTTEDSLLPPFDILNDIVDAYFVNVHPWIPVIHIASFKDKIQDPNERRTLTTILQAMVSICFRFEERSGLSHTAKREWAVECRNAVILAGMNRFSVTNLQAMVIVSFDIIASGRGPSSWSIIGSMTRTVEQLQLSVEDEDAPGNYSGNGFMIRRVKFLRSPSSWREVEERRRIFWNVFLMDRFCSIATGWNNSLTSADVRRRLPCEGALWQIGNPVTAPWFGDVDRPVPAQQVSTPANDALAAPDEESQVIGGFAFCIEATENLNLVTKFFLQHALKFDDAQNIEIWLLKFKELDLRLVKWRIFLPAKWRNACALNQDGIMDPNLTLAHITHNTAVIQLHQAVAYPDARWRHSRVTVPSATSAETCVAAAREISIIASEFLAQSATITNPQFSFCLFIAGRVLLTHSRRHVQTLDAAFDQIVGSLQDIAQRWSGPLSDGRRGGSRRPAPQAATGDVVADQLDEAPQTLASQFAKRLSETKTAATRQGSEEPRTSHSLDIHQSVYVGEEVHDGISRDAPPLHSSGARQRPEHACEMPLRADDRTSYQQALPNEATYTPDSVSMAFPPLPVALDYTYPFSAPVDSESLEVGHTMSGDNAFAWTDDVWGSGGTRISTFAEPQVYL